LEPYGDDISRAIAPRHIQEKSRPIRAGFKRMTVFVRNYWANRNSLVLSKAQMMFS